MRHRLIRGLIAHLLVAPMLLAAAEVRLSLEDAVAAALRNNPDVLRAAQEVEAARGRTLTAAAIPNPEVVFSREGLGDTSGGGESEINLGISQTLEFPGKRPTRIHVGKLGEDIGRLELDRIKMATASRVEGAYWRAVYAREVVETLEATAAVLENYLELARERYRYGQVEYLDVLRGQVESLKLRNELVEAGRDVRETVAQLALLLGLESGDGLVLTSKLGHPPLLRSLEQLQEELDKNGPSLKLAAAELKRAEVSLELSKKSAYPDLQIALFYPSLRTKAWGFELGLEIPLWAQGRRGAIVEAGAETRRSRISLEAERSRLRASLGRSYADLKSAEEQLKLFEQSLLRDIEDAWKAAVFQYQFGRTDALNILDLYRSYKETQREFRRTLLNYNLSLVEVKALGETLGS